MSNRSGLIGLYNDFRDFRKAQKRASSSGDFSLTDKSLAALFSDYGEIAALNISAFWNAVTLIAGHIAALPLKVYRRLPDGGREEAKDHPLYRVLKYKANPYMTSYQWRECQMVHMELYNELFVYVFRPTYDHIELFPLLPDRTWRRKVDGVYRIITIVDGKQLTIPESDVIHIPGLTFDGINGINPFRCRKLSLSLMAAAEKSANEFYHQGAAPGGILEYPGRFTGANDERYLRLKQETDQNYAGLGKHHRMMILEDGQKFQPLQFDAEKIQMLSTRKFTPSEVARWMNIPPHKLKDLERATFSNIEQQNIDYVVDSLLPRLVRLEQGLSAALLADSELDTHYIEFNVDGLLRGDSKQRAESYAIQRQNGVLTANQWAQKENMNPIPKTEGGDLRLVPMNMIPLNTIASYYGDQSKSGDTGSEGSTGERSAARMLYARCKRDATSRRMITRNYQPLIKGVFDTVVGMDVKGIRKAADDYLKSGNVTGFVDWAIAFYKDFRAEVTKTVGPVISTFGNEIRDICLSEINSKMDVTSQVDRFAKSFIEVLGLRYSTNSIARLKHLINVAAKEERDPYKDITDQADEWEEGRASKSAEEESVRAENAFSRAAWAAAAVTKVMWISSGKSCPYCDSLNGKIIGIDQSFISAGEEFKPDGAEYALTPSTNISHGPAHDACDCGLGAVT